MTVARRLANLEADLDPTQRVMAWLAEAHAYDTLEEYLSAVINADPSQLPMDRLPREAAAAARRQRHGSSRDRDDAVHRAIRDAVLRVHLVLRIVDRTDAVIRREELVVALLTAYVSLALAKEQEPGGCLPLVQLRDLLLARVAELLAQEEARRLVEARYLGGHSSLFPATGRRWQELVHQAQKAAVMTLRLAELGGAEPIDEARQLLPDPGRIEACIADFVEVPRIKTLDDVGEGHAALPRLRRWLATSGGPGSGMLPSSPQAEAPLRANRARQSATWLRRLLPRRSARLRASTDYWDRRALGGRASTSRGAGLRTSSLTTGAGSPQRISAQPSTWRRTP